MELSRLEVFCVLLVTMTAVGGQTVVSSQNFGKLYVMEYMTTGSMKWRELYLYLGVNDS